MSNLYNLDGIKTQLKKDIAHDNAILQALKAITFPTKKDGAPFAIMSKNFVGATYRPIDHAMQHGEYELYVGAWSQENGYVHTIIPCYELVKYLKDENKIVKIENYQPKVKYLEQLYKYDIDDVKQAIEERIAFYEKSVAALEKQLAIADNVYYHFIDCYRAAVATLATESRKSEDSTLYHYILDTVKARYPYI